MVSQVSQYKVPDVKLPDIKVPDIKVPDVKVPDATWPSWRFGEFTNSGVWQHNGEFGGFSELWVIVMLGMWNFDIGIKQTLVIDF